MESESKEIFQSSMVQQDPTFGTQWKRLGGDASEVVFVSQRDALNLDPQRTLTLPYFVLGIPKDELISSASSALQKLLDIISCKNSNLSDRKIACIYVARLIGDSTEKIMNLFISALQTLMSEPEFKDRYTFFFSTEEYKFNSYVTQNLHEYYFKSFPEPLLYRILSAGYLLEYKKISDSFRDSIEQYLINLAKNKDLSESLRSECADILKRVGKESSVREIGAEVISILSHNSSLKVRGLDTIYMNKQNAHSKDVEESALATLQKIATTEFKTCSLTSIKSELLSIGNENTDEKIDVALNRLFIDPIRYDGYTLPTILYIVWDKIQRRAELKRRLYEELVEMDKTCSSGIFVRLMNTFTGTEFCGVNISFENEIRGAVFARLNSYLELQGSEIKETIMTEMVENGSKDTLIEFVERFSPKEELEKEYDSLLPKEEFGKLYQKAIEAWGGVGFRPPP